MGDKFTIYTDGSCLGNPGPGGWAVVFDIPEGRASMSGGYRLTTNNRMELMAVINALEAVSENSKVKIMTDSRLVCDAINKEWLRGWKRKSWRKSDGGAVKNIDLWKKLDALMATRQVSIVWIKGHNDNPRNEQCDLLARTAASQPTSTLGYDDGYTEQEAANA